MKRDLLIGAAFVLAASLVIGGVMFVYTMQTDDNAPKTIKPRPEPIAQLQPKETRPEPKTPVEIVKKIPIKETKQPKTEPTKTKVDEPKVIAKVEPPIKIEPKPEIKQEAPVVKLPPAKEIVLGNIVRIKNPDGEYTVETMNSGELILIGKIKTLKIGGANAASILDASGLDAEEIIFSGDINGNSKILLHAPKGTVTFQREINGKSQIEVVAPEGRVVFKSTHASIINGESKLTIVAKDVLFLGDINGTKTTVDVTLTNGGSLKFLRILGGVRLHYGKADAGDPEPRVESGVIGPNAELRKVEPGKK